MVSQTAKVVSEAERSERRSRVLLVDDDPSESGRICGLLSSNDFDVETTSSVNGLEDRAVNGYYDIILSEAFIADQEARTYVDVTTVLRNILKRAREAGYDTQAVLSSLILRPEHIENYGDMGVSDIVPKPASDSQILGTLDDVLSRDRETLSQVPSVEDLATYRHIFSRVPELRPRKKYEKGQRIILTGLSTAGKSTLAELCCKIAYSLETPARLTTRPRRDSETNAVDKVHVGNNEFTICEALGEVVPYIDGNYRYSANTPEPVGVDYIIPICADGFKKMAELYPGAKLVYCGVSLDTMAERLKDRPGNEAGRYNKAQECIKTFRGFFPISGSDRVFDEVILTDALTGNRYSDTLICARKLLRYVASLRN